MKIIGSGFNSPINLQLQGTVTIEFLVRMRPHQIQLQIHQQRRSQNQLIGSVLSVSSQHH